MFKECHLLECYAVWLIRTGVFGGTYRLHLQKYCEYIVFIRSVLRLLVTANVPSSLIHVTLMMEAIHSSETSVLKQPCGETTQETAFFIVTTVKTLNLS
jgi:hypothetical protein